MEVRSFLYLVFGSLFTIASAWALGVILLRRLQLTMHWAEETPLAFVTGSACLSSLVFILCCTHLIYKEVVLAVGAIVIVCAFRTKSKYSLEPHFPALTRMWIVVASLVGGAFALLYLCNALAPEVSPDGTAFHVAIAARYARAHGFQRVTWNMLFNMSHGVELLYLFAFTLGKHSATAMVHLAFLLALPWLMFSYSRRLGFPVAGLAAALFVFVSPIVGIDGTSAYLDVALAAVLFALFYFLELWSQDGNPRLLVPIAILAGFAFAVKYTGFVAIPYAMAVVGWKLRRGRRPILRPLATIAVIASVFVVPWLAKNALFVKNPISPFANRLFPNPFVHVSTEQDYRTAMQMDINNLLRLPLELTVKGDALQGIVGPLFLLAPLSLAALKHPSGRRLLLAAGVFAVPYAAALATRFLIPALPFLSLALALALVNLRPLLLGLVLLHAVGSWPAVMGWYCDRWAWRLQDMPVRAALRIEHEGDYLTRRSFGYSVANMLDHTVPDGERVFALTSTAEAYTKRDVLVKRQAATNELLGDILYAPFSEEWGQSHVLECHFQERNLRGIRLRQTAAAPEGQGWSITDIRIVHGGVPLRRDSAWRITAHPNPWDVEMAFDGKRVTRWQTWETASPDMYIEANFDESHLVDSVEVQCSIEPYIRLELDGLDPSGRWTPLGNAALARDEPDNADLRKAATAELKERGIRYLLIGRNDLHSDDFAQHPAAWGLSQLGERVGVRLYRID